MTSTFTGPTGSSPPTSEHRVQVRTGPFMLTLCELAAPVTIRPPQSPQLKAFTFFTSTMRQPDGSEKLYLHMGYFETLSDAERWAQIARGRYPQAIVTIAPGAPSRSPKSEAAGSETAVARPHGQDQAASANESLTDTQVLRILDARYAGSAQDTGERSSDQIALLRPDDTSTRHALKEAVSKGAPVFFVVQLHWAEEPINLARVPSLPIFKTHTLYASESRREGRSRYFLRLGFFEDPSSAKQVAVQVRAKFASAAVVPVAEQEVARAREARTDTAAIPYLAELRTDGTARSNAESETQSKPSRDLPGKVTHAAETLEQTLEQLAARESWTNPDALSETGVRHLKVEVQEQPTIRR